MPRLTAVAGGTEPGAAPPLRAKVFAATLAGAAVAASLVHLALYLRGFYAISADECGHTLEAWRWMHDRSQVASTWLPFQRVVLAFALEARSDLFVVPRLVSFGFGLLALLAMSWLALELSGDRRVAALTALLAAVFPQRVVLALVPLAEIMFIAQVAAGMALLARWTASGRTSALLASAGAFALATTTRYEGWVFAACFLLHVWVVSLTGRRAARRPLAVRLAAATVLIAAFPLYWIGLHWLKNGNPFLFMSHTATLYAAKQGDRAGALLAQNVLVQLLIQNAASLNIVGLAALAGLARNHRRVRGLAWVSGGALLVMSALSILGKGLPSHNFWRIPAVWSALLVPFTAWWIAGLARRPTPLRGARPLDLRAAGALALVLLAFSFQSARLTERSRFSRADREAGRYLAARLGAAAPSARILVDSSDWSYLNLVVASQHPDAFEYNSGPDPNRPLEPLVGPHSPADPARLASRGIRFLAVKSAPLADEVGRLPGATRRRGFGDWTIYELDGHPAPTAFTE